MQYGHNIRLKEDAAASLGTNHVNFKAAAHFVELKDNQLMTAMGLTPDIWQSEPVKATQEERFKVRERELLEWVGIDPAVKIIYNKFN